VSADTAVELSRAATMIELGHYDEAVGLLSVVVATEPDAARAWSLLSRAHLGAGRAGEALQAARRAGELNPSDDWPYRLASTALVSLGEGRRRWPRRRRRATWRRPSGARMCAWPRRRRRRPTGRWRPRRSRRRWPSRRTSRMSSFTAGKVALSRGNLAMAREHQQAALAIDPAHSGAINELGRISLRERDVSAAAGYFLRAARASPGVGIFGRNTEVALAKVLTSIAVPAALVIAIGIDLRILTGIRPVPFAIVMAALIIATAGYAAVRLRRLPADGRRHLARMLRRRQWLLTVGAIMIIVAGLGALAATMIDLGQSGSSALLPGFVVILVVAAARLLVTMVIHRSRRNIR